MFILYCFLGEKKIDLRSKPFDRFYVHWIFSFLSSKKRWPVLITAVARVWFDTSAVAPWEGHMETSSMRRPGAPHRPSLLTEGVWLTLLHATEKDKNKNSFYSCQLDGNKCHEVVHHWRSLVSGMRLCWRASCTALANKTVKQSAGVCVRGRRWRAAGLRPPALASRVSFWFPASGQGTLFGLRVFGCNWTVNGKTNLMLCFFCLFLKN